MPVSLTPSPGHQRTGERLIARIRPGMHVEDATGKTIGDVIYVRLHAANAVDEATLESTRHGATELSGVLLRNDYFKFDAQQQRCWDKHYYAMADDVATIDEDIVRLRTPLDELMTPYT